MEVISADTEVWGITLETRGIDRYGWFWSLNIRIIPGAGFMRPGMILVNGVIYLYEE